MRSGEKRRAKSEKPKAKSQKRTAINGLYSSGEGDMVSSVGLKPDEQVQSRPAGSYTAPAKISYLPGLALFVLAIALYYPVRTHPFVNYDDNIYVINNDHVQNGLTWDTTRWAFTAHVGGNWHPLTWLSHAADVQWFDLNPGRHHQTSMLLHAFNATLLFWVLVRATGYAGRSFMVAALFAVHPINVESVVWIAERKTVLSMTFFLLALGAYGWYAARPRVGSYAAVAGLFALGLMAKPQIITFPLYCCFGITGRCDGSLFALRFSRFARIALMKFLANKIGTAKAIWRRERKAD